MSRKSITFVVNTSRVVEQLKRLDTELRSSDPDVRRRAYKTAHFGRHYGMGAREFSRALAGVEQANVEAAELMRRWASMFVKQKVEDRGFRTVVVTGHDGVTRVKVRRHATT